MKNAILGSLLVLALGVSADPPFARERAVLVPAGPTNVTPIEVRALLIACFPESHTIERSGNTFTIHITLGPMEVACDPNPWNPNVHRIALGVLPVGEYALEISVGNPSEVRIRRKFIVRNGIPLSMEVHPFAALPNEIPFESVRLHAHDGPICAPSCEDVSIWVGGILVKRDEMKPTPDGAVVFNPPHRNQGLVDVVVTTPRGTVTLPGSLYLFDLTGQPDDSVFERILFPILEKAKGSFGSVWESELAIANTKPWIIDNYNYVEPIACDHRCAERRHPGFGVAFSGRNYPRGKLLLSPRAEAPNLSFSLRVRDTSREADGFGTQIPVVRERDMFTNGVLTLLDVPIDPLYRSKVRMYSLAPGDHKARLTMVRRDESQATQQIHEVPLLSESDGHSLHWYAEFDLPAGRENERANLYVEIGERETPAWAFASVTNNATQQVTIVTADGSGGEPACDPCLP